MTDVVSTEPPQGPRFTATPVRLTTTAAELPHEVTEECFGPGSVVPRCADGEELFAARRIDGALVLPHGVSG